MQVKWGNSSVYKQFLTPIKQDILKGQRFKSTNVGTPHQIVRGN